MEKTIVVVEDHPIVRKGMVQLINCEDDLCSVGEADSIISAHEIIKKSKPNLVLIDLSLNGSSGLELIKDLSHSYPDILTIAVSLHDENVYAERVLRAGARGYIMKSEATESILAAIRLVLDGGIYLSPPMQTKMLNKITGGKDSSVMSLDLLSDREFEVFEMIGLGKSTKEIAKDLNLSIKTIETYKSHIKVKLNNSSSTELLQSAIEWKIKSR